MLRNGDSGGAFGSAVVSVPGTAGRLARRRSLGRGLALLVFLMGAWVVLGVLAGAARAEDGPSAGAAQGVADDGPSDSPGVDGDVADPGSGSTEQSIETPPVTAPAPPEAPAAPVTPPEPAAPATPAEPPAPVEPAAPVMPAEPTQPPETAPTFPSAPVPFLPAAPVPADADPGTPATTDADAGAPVPADADPGTPATTDADAGAPVPADADPGTPATTDAEATEDSAAAPAVDTAPGAEATDELTEADGAGAVEPAVAHDAVAPSACEAPPGAGQPFPAEVVGASSSDHDRSPGATVTGAGAHVAEQGSSPPSGRANSTVLAFIATSAPEDGAQSPAQSPMPVPLPPAPPAPAGPCTSVSAGSHTPGGGQQGGSVLDLAVLGRGIPATTLPARGLAHGSPVDPVTDRADDPGSSPG